MSHGVTERPAPLKALKIAVHRHLQLTSSSPAQGRDRITHIGKQLLQKEKKKKKTSTALDNRKISAAVRMPPLQRPPPTPPRLHNLLRRPTLQNNGSVGLCHDTCLSPIPSLGLASRRLMSGHNYTHHSTLRPPPLLISAGYNGTLIGRRLSYLCA